MTSGKKTSQTTLLLLGLVLGVLGLSFVGWPFGSRLSARSVLARPGAAPSQPSPEGARTTQAALAPTQRLIAADQTPQGLAPSDWSSIQAAYEQGRHRVFPVAGGYQARNPGQQWRTHFDGRGFAVQPDAGQWRWGLELRGYGFEQQTRDLSGTARVTTDGARVTYAWDETVEEWFVNDQRGLEHGFTLKQPPASGAGAGARLELRLGVRGGLRPKVQAGGRGVSFVNAAGGTMVNYTGLKVWDADGRELRAEFEAEAEGLRLRVEAGGARYPLTIDPIAQQAYLKASNTEADDRFGQSVAISGDTVVVGAWQEDSNATGVDGDQSDNSAPDSGAAYVFVRSSGSWSQQAYLKASNTEAGDFFGQSVAISGDTVVVGAHREDSNATGVNGNQSDNSAFNAGAAYVFVRSGGSWSQQAYLKASNTEAVDQFGYSVAISGDTIVVGAINEASNATGVNGNQSDNSATGSGAAYVFVRSGGSWSQQAYLKASNTEGDGFGGSVAISGDTVVVGAFGEDSNATGVNGDQSNNSAFTSGAAYVFVRSGGSWSQQAYLKASNTGIFDQFGYSVAISGDTVVVGAYSESSNATGVNGNQSNNSATFSGAAYVFVRSGGSWSQQAYLKASNTEAFDFFGQSVAISGDTVVVGAHRESSNATGVNGDQSNNSAFLSGAAYVFVRSSGSWSQQAYLKASNTEANDAFGISVAISGDTVVVGAWGEDSNATGVNGNQSDNIFTRQSGAAYIFTGLNQAPVAQCQNVTVVADNSCTADASIDNGSYDPDAGDSITLTQYPAGPYPLGNTTVTLTVTDSQGAFSSCQAVVTVVDQTAPTITLTGAQIALWPPNHQYETINLAQLVASASDNCGGNLTGNVVIAQVSSDEPEDAPGGGDGNTLNDIVIAADCKSVQLRVERQGSGNGRVYTITFKVKDAAGNTTTATAKVTVPKSQGNNGAAIDDGPAYTKTGGCP